MLGVVALQSLVMHDWFIHRGLFAQDTLHTIKKKKKEAQNKNINATPYGSVPKSTGVELQVSNSRP